MEPDLYTADTGTQVDTVVLDQGNAGTVGGLTVTFDRESQFTGLNVARDPGVTLVWLGALLLFVGFVIRFTIPHKRVWARITARANGGAVLGLASLGNREATLATEFENLVTTVRQALQAPARS